MAIGYTPYSLSNQAFSDKAHLRAQADIYPRLFGVRKDQLDFTVLSRKEAQILDYEQAIDRTVRVQVPTLMGKLKFTVQERFRRSEYARRRFDDVTITEWNHNSNVPSELYKITAMLFLYGYYDEHTDCFNQAIAFYVCPLLTKIARGEIIFNRQKNNKNQSFIGVRFDELRKHDLVAFYDTWKEVQHA